MRYRRIKRTPKHVVGWWLMGYPYNYWGWKYIYRLGSWVYNA